MDIEQIVSMAVNNGTAIVIIGYFMYRDFKFMDTLKQTLTTLVDSVNTLKAVVSQIKGDDKDD